MTIALPTKKTQSEIKKSIRLEGDSQGVVFLNDERIGQYSTTKGHGGNAVLVASLSKNFGNKVSAGKKESLVSALAKKIYHKSQEEVA